MGAAGVKRAAPRRRQRRRNVSLKNYAAFFCTGARHRNRRDERLRVWVPGIRKPFGREYLHELAQVHHRDPVAYVLHDLEVVRDEEIGQTEALPQIRHQVQYLAAYREIQRRNRLVRDYEPGHERYRPGDPHPLALAAGELVRVTGGGVRGEADEANELRYPVRTLARVLQLAVHHEGLSYDVAYGHSRIQRGERVLKDYLHLPAQRSQPALGCPRYVAAVE